MIFNGSFASFPISHQFSTLFNGNFTFFSFFGQFSMLFNGELAFCQFSMLFNGNLRIGSLGGGNGRTYGRTYGNSPLCSTGHRPFGAAAQKGEEEGEKDRKVRERNHAKTHETDNADRQREKIYLTKS